jgi:CubicO group peptidase (beta-lactamase class C family)
MAQVALAQSPDTSWQARMDSTIARIVREQRIPGLAVGIVRHGEIAYARGFGVMSLEHGTPVTPTTLFHMASVTKPFVATAVMQLVERGKIRLDAPVVTYLPYFRLRDPRGASITIRQLLTHTSGLPDVIDYEWGHPQTDDGALERYVRSLADRPLLWDPGSRYSYSNIGFEILGDVIAKVSGMPFETYVAREILDPLRMTSSSLLLTRVDPAQLASGYTRASRSDDAPNVAIVAYPYNRVHGPSSNLMSSVMDMSRWAMANLRHGELDGTRILSATSYNVLWKRGAEVEFCRPPGHTDCRKPGGSVGLSWFLQDKDGQLIVSHGGGDDGFITEIVLIPGRDFALVMMSNSDAAGVPGLRTIESQALRLELYPGP